MSLPLFSGYQAAFDTSKSKLVKNNFGFGYANGDFKLHTNVNDGQVRKQCDTNAILTLITPKSLRKFP